MAVAAPQAALAGRAPQDNLLVTFWKNGCGQTGVGNSKTFVVNAQDGPSKPEACETNGLYNFQSVQIQQPSNGQTSYAIDFFSGEGCNNPVGTYSEDGCYTQPEGVQIITFRAHLN